MNNGVLHNLVYAIREKRISCLSLFINSECNLKCLHCYVGYHCSRRDYLSTEKMVSIMEEAIHELGAKNISIAGKEPLLDLDRVEKIFGYLNRKRGFAEFSDIKFGLVTNGTVGGQRAIDCFKKTKPDFVDISIDGSRNTHDEIRGRGSFNKATKTLKAFLKNEVNVFVSHTLCSVNFKDDKFLKEMAGIENLKQVNISPYFYPSHGDCLTISAEDYAKKIEKIVLNSKEYCFRIIFRFDDKNMGIFKKLLERKIFSLHEIKKSKNGIVYFQNRQVCATISPFPVEMWHSVRITANGYVSGCREMSLCGGNYTEVSRGNVKKEKLTQIVMREKEKICKSFERRLT